MSLDAFSRIMFHDSISKVRVLTILGIIFIANLSVVILSGQIMLKNESIDLWESKNKLVIPFTIRIQSTDNETFNKLLNNIPSRDIIGIYRPLYSAVIKYKPEYIRWIFLHNIQIKAVDVSYNKLINESYLNTFDSSVNQIDIAKVQNPHLKGLDQYIFLKEDSPLDDDIDLFGKINLTSVSSSIKNVHANDMATIITGLGNTFYNSLGIVSEAVIYTTNFQNLLPDDVNLVETKPIKIQNHSYGVGIENYYGIEAQAYDDATFFNPEFLPIFSAGNRGLFTSDSGPYQNLPGVANLTGTFKMAKNVLTVGSIDSSNRVTAISSRGPAYDGRTKPDLVAFGFNGSSESAAIATGVASLIREALIENGTLPHSSLIKAIMINGADDVENLGPDFATGFGSINAYKSLKITESQTYLSQTLASNIFEYEVSLPEGIRSLKTTLVWNDPPGEINARKALVRDLDLKIITPEDTLYPLVLDPYPSISSLNKIAKQGKDTLNTVEQVFIENPGNGIYRMIVAGPQSTSFSIAYSIEKSDTAIWTYPVKNSVLKANQKNILRWQSSYAQPPGQLKYRYLDSNDWIEIPFDTMSNLIAFTPESAGTIIEFCLKFGRDSVISDPVLVSGIPSVDLINQCTDYLVFEVNNNLEADSFALLKLEGGEYRIVDITAGPILEYNGTYTSSDYFAVLPFYDDDKGIQSLALALKNQFANCFIQYFQGETINNEIEISAEFNLSEKISQVYFEKLVADKFIKLEEFSSAITNSLSTTDENPSLGPNFYRVTIVLKNGLSVTSDVLEIYYIPKDDFLVFPSLMRDEKSLYILQQDFRLMQFSLYNSKGTKIIDEQILSTSEEISLDNVSPGIYYYNILNTDYVIVKSGKIVVSE